MTKRILTLVFAGLTAGMIGLFCIFPTEVQAQANRKPASKLASKPVEKKPLRTAALTGKQIYRTDFSGVKLPAQTTADAASINTRQQGGMTFLRDDPFSLSAKKDLTLGFRFFFHDGKRIRLTFALRAQPKDKKDPLKQSVSLTILGNAVSLDSMSGERKERENIPCRSLGLPDFRGQVWYDGRLVFDNFGSCVFYLMDQRKEWVRIAEIYNGIMGARQLLLSITGGGQGQVADVIAEASPSPASPLKEITGGVELIGAGTLSASLEKQNDQISCDVRFGPRGGEMILEFSNGEKTVVPVRIRAEKHMPDSVLMFAFPSIQENRKPEFDSAGREKKIPPRTVDYYARPRLERYSAGNINKYINAKAFWQTLPAASVKKIHLEFQQAPDGIRMYADGRYFACEKAPSRLAKVHFRLGATAALWNVKSENRPDESHYLTLDGRFISRPGAMKNAKITLEPGLRKINGIPIRALAPSESIEINQFAVMRGGEDLMYNQYLSRTALDGMPQSIHLSLPRAFYCRAWILCAAEPSNAYKDEKKRTRPHFNARLTRFAGYDSWGRGGNEGRGGDAIADTYLTLPWDRADENHESFYDSASPVRTIRSRSCKTCFSCVDYGFKLPESNMVEVGKVTYVTDAGKETTVPLFLVEAVLDPGKIIDLINDPADRYATMRVAGGYLDFELTRAMQNTAWSKGDSHHNPLWSDSTVNVFGVTLERAPVDMRIEQPQPGLVFFNDEKTDVPVEFTCTRPGECVFSWLVYDESGTKVASGSTPFRMNSPGEKKTLSVHLPIEQPGWYGVDFMVSAPDGRIYFRHKAACAQMGRDTRTAGYESPYGTWHFADMHNGEDKPEIYGPMLLKAGIRKIPAYTKFTEKDLAPWKISLSQIPYFSFRGTDPLSDDPVKRKAAEDALEAHITKFLTKFPSVRTYNIFHESFPDSLPPELFDEKPVLKPDQLEYARKRAGILNFTAEYYKKHHPGFQNTIVNTSTGAEGTAILLRGGAKRENIDFIGIESPAQACMPEKPDNVGPQSAWFARETARKFGMEIPLSSCWESDYRVERLLGMQRAAEWYARDMLLMRAYDYHHVCVGLLYDCGNSYFNTLWGGSGICYRTNLYYPKRAYVAIGTVTKMLDRAKLLRQLESGSPVVYVFEYQRADGRFVYPFWMPAGSAELEFHAPNGLSGVVLTGTYGRETALPAISGRIRATAKTGPCYLVSEQKLLSVSTVRYTHEVMPGFSMLEKMDSLTNWKVFKQGLITWNRSSETSPPIVKRGRAKVTAVDDPEHGKCLEVELIRDEKAESDLAGESIYIQLRKPVPIPPNALEIGMWVQGDGGWGKIIFEVFDEEGGLFRSHYGSYHDWDASLSINYTGWRLHTYPFNAAGKISPGPVGRWYGGGGMQKPAWLSGIHLILKRKALNPTEMKDVPARIRLGGIGVILPEPKNNHPQER